MKNFWEGFYKKAEEDPSRAPEALAAGAGGIVAGRKLVKTIKRERAEKLIPKSKSWNHFMRSLKPGDVLISNPVKSKDFVSKAIGPVINTFGGSKHTHTQIYTGKGKLLETAGPGYSVAMDNAKLQLSRGQDVIAYRPKMKEKAIQKGIAEGKKLLGAKYEGVGKMLGRGVNMAAGMTQKACHLGKGDRVVCTDVIAKAYPKIMPNRYSTVESLQSNKHLKPVAHLNRLHRGKGAFFYKGLHPALSALKVGLPVYGVAKAIQAMRDKKKAAE